jgi:hypothetical protein
MLVRYGKNQHTVGQNVNSPKMKDFGILNKRQESGVKSQESKVKNFFPCSLLPCSPVSDGIPRNGANVFWTICATFYF